MAGNINKIILIGELGCDPEMRSAQAGECVVSFSLATSESWRDRTSGERRERTEWHHTAIFSEQLAEVAFRYLRKGSKVYIEGQLRSRQRQDQEGPQRSTIEIVLSQHRGELVMLDSRRDAGARLQFSDADAPRGRSRRRHSVLTRSG
jgi:single-strand DNA-binding protein